MMGPTVCRVNAHTCLCIAVLRLETSIITASCNFHIMFILVNLQGRRQLYLLQGHIPFQIVYNFCMVPQSANWTILIISVDSLSINTNFELLTCESLLS